MPIFSDPSEIRHLPAPITSRPDFFPVQGLELQTGADMVLSVLDAPTTTPALHWIHIQYGAGYQLKRGTDLMASVYDGRLIRQLVKMLNYWKAPVWLLHTGDVKCHEDGETTLLNSAEFKVGERRAFPYKAYQTVKRNWQLAGGCWQTLAAEYLLSDWIDDELMRMGKDRPDRLVPLQDVDKELAVMEMEPHTQEVIVNLIELTLQERTLATCPYMGSKRAHDLWMVLKEYNAQTLAQGLVWLTDGLAAKRVPGIGKGITEAVKEHLGLDKCEYLTIGFDIPDDLDVWSEETK